MKTRTKYLTEAQAWRVIAEAFFNREREGLAWSGLCFAHRNVRPVTARVRARMAARVFRTFNEDGQRAGYWWPSHAKDIDVGREERIAACLLLALLAEGKERLG